MPALLTLDIPGFEGRKLLLIAFLVLVVQSSDVLQYVWGKLVGRHKIAPIAVALQDRGRASSAASRARPLLGAALWWITPFSALQAARDGARHQR